MTDVSADKSNNAAEDADQWYEKGQDYEDQQK